MSGTDRKKVAEITEDPETGQLYVENEEEVIAVQPVKPIGSVIVRRHRRNRPRGKERRHE